MIAVFAVGCRSANLVHDPEYVRDVHRVHEAGTLSSGSELAPAVNELGGPHSVDTYISRGFDSESGIQAARKQVEAAAFRVPQAASLQDPMFKMTTYPEPVQTAAGQQKLLLNVSQKFPWFGKLRAQADVAEFNTNVVRAQLAAVELSVIEERKSLPVPDWSIGVKLPPGSISLPAWTQHPACRSPALLWSRNNPDTATVPRHRPTP